MDIKKKIRPNIIFSAHMPGKMTLMLKRCCRNSKSMDKLKVLCFCFQT